MRLSTLDPISEIDGFWHLKRCPLFDQLTEDEMAALKASGRQIDVFRMNRELDLIDEKESIFIVKMGYLKVVRRSSGGKKEWILFLGPGDVFQKGDERIRTVTPVCILQVNRSSFEGLVRSHPNLAFTLTKVSLFRIQKLEVRLADTLLCSPEIRLAKALVELNTSFGADTLGTESGVWIRLTQGDLAKLIGTSREYVSRVLGSFRHRGWIETNGRSIRVRNEEVLKRLAGSTL